MVGVSETIAINGNEYYLMWNGHGQKDWNKLDNIVNEVIKLTEKLNTNLEEFTLSFDDDKMNMSVGIIKK